MLGTLHTNTNVTGTTIYVRCGIAALLRHYGIYYLQVSLALRFTTSSPSKFQISTAVYFILYILQFGGGHITGELAQWIARQTSDLKVLGSSPRFIDSFALFEGG